MKTKFFLMGFLAVMAGMIIFAIFFRAEFIALLNQPALYIHARFVHIAAVTLFFSNAVLGMLWERRSLESGSAVVILHTYRTVAWVDALVSSPLIILSVVSGLALGFMMGDLWQVGWLSAGFILFIFSGIFWVLSDIPTQYKVKRLMAVLEPGTEELPAELVRLLKLRWWISLGGVVPLVVVFVLMVYQPDIPAPASWFR
jgi:uncharacterized membrane protein